MPNIFRYRHSVVGNCVTEQECGSLLNGTWWIFQGECIKACPPRYYRIPSEYGGCKFCGDQCKKECPGMQVDSIASAQRLRGCTHINGSLSIKVASKSTADELEENLGLIEEIYGYLKIYRSHPLTTLEFLKKLRIIHGRELDNKKHALVVFENYNLYKLWDENATLAIKKGTISFHYNSHLCLAEIERIVSITGLYHSYTSIDVSPYSNGDKTTCHYIEIKISIIELTARNITLSWENFNIKNKKAVLIGYLLYYIEDPLGNMTVYDEQDECDVNGWDSIFVSNNTRQIVNLNPNTQYAYYIKAYTSVLSAGGQTKIAHFTTLSDDPSVPINFDSNSTSSASITLFWEKPRFPNGVLNYYLIVVYFQKDNYNLISERNYCHHPHVDKQYLNNVNAEKHNLWSNSTHNATCCKKEDTFSIGDFDDFCNLLENEKMSNLKATSCKNYMKFVNDTDELEEMQQFKIKDSNLTSYVIKDLQHFTKYVFLLKACNNESQCSAPVMTFNRTLSKRDADDILSNLVVVVERSDVFVQWSEPQEPNSAIVAYQIEHRRTDLEHSKDLIECIKQEEYAISGTGYRLRNFLPGKYSIRVKGISLAGEGRFSEMVHFEIKAPTHAFPPVLIVIPILIIFSVAGGIIYYVFYYRRKHTFDNLHLITNVNPDYAGPIYVADEWELERDDIDVLKALGQGTFGMVYNGYIKSQNRPCAIKTVNDNTEIHEKMSFLNEASVMKSFSDAHHVVKLLGVVSKGLPPLVIMELMARGDLKTFLRKSRDSSSSITCAEMYRMSAEIADGMMYLSAKKFVHRDLAARNCMVAADFTVKIGDFGMTRDIYETDYYRKETRGLMPVRWMSPESLADGVFTSDSDVWSYGVVLWEMATLAEQPYQGLANEQVLQFVIAQGTLERPAECPDLLYEIMDACWKWKPNHRPLFKDIVEKLEPNVGQNFRLVSFYHSADGEEYRMHAKDRVYNPPALTAQLSKTLNVHWNASEDEASVYSSSMESKSNNPTPLLSSIDHQSKSIQSGNSYR